MNTKNGLNKKNKVLDISAEDFTTPIAFKKFKSSATNVPNVSEKHKSRKPIKKRQVTLHQVIKENFHYSDVNPECLQMALSLSESLSDEQAKSSEEKISYSQDLLKHEKKKTLLEFGFQTSKSTMNVQNKMSGKKANFPNKRSKFRFITPVLMMRTDEDRNSLIEAKISIILSRNSNTNLSECHKLTSDIFSKELMKISCPKCCLFRSSFHKRDNFIVKSLNILKNGKNCGSLLKDWKSIPLRDHTPERITSCIQKDDKISINDATEKINAESYTKQNDCSDEKRKKSVSVECRVNSSYVNEELKGIMYKNPDEKYDMSNKISGNLKNACVTSPDLFDDGVDNIYETTKPRLSQEKLRKNLFQVENLADLTHNDIMSNIKNSLDDTTKSNNNVHSHIESWSLSDNGSFHSINNCDTIFITNSSDEENELKIHSIAEDNLSERYNSKILSELSEREQGRAIENASVIDKNVILNVNEGERTFSDEMKNILKLCVTDDEADNVVAIKQSHGKNDLTQENNSSPSNTFSKLYSSNEYSNLDCTNFDNASITQYRYMSEMNEGNKNSKSKSNRCVDEISCELDRNYAEKVFTTSSDKDDSSHLALKSVYGICNNIVETETVIDIEKYDRLDSANFKNNSDESIDKCSQSFEDVICISDEELNYSSIIRHKYDGSLINESNSITSDLNSPKITTADDLKSIWNKEHLFTSDLEKFNDDLDNKKICEPHQECGVPFRKFSSFSEISSPKAKNSLTRNKSDSNITPDKRYIIKTKDITPSTNYDTLNTPEIIKELDRFGLKPLKRKRGVNLLKHIYEMTHPIVELQGLQEVKECERQVKKFKEKEIFDLKQIPVKEPWIEDINKSEAILERKRSSKTPSCPVPLQLAWHNLLVDNPNIRENVLLYEPLQVEVIHDMLKAQGFKFNVQDLITYFDQKCITIRIAQNHNK